MTKSEEQESFRDHIGTVDKKGKRIWLYPKKPAGRFYNWRKITSVVLLLILFIAPFIRYKGNPLFLFNVIERKFILFGITFWPQDFHLFVLAMLTFMVFIVLFTVVFGRVWCGWACPQTVFMEMVFRRIEYWIEGDANQQKKLNAAPWDVDKVLKKSFKWSIFYAISFMIGNLLMIYIVGSDAWWKIVSQPPTENISGFIAVMAFSGVFFFIFAKFREQACIAVCPYGRLQGVFLDKNSIAVMYDWLRGEPRGKLRKKAEQSNQGDCVDCNLCVQVCPTGIDIRHGTQMECVNCTACIDACDEVMDKIKKPRGLIKLASYNNIETRTSQRFTLRIAAYTAVLVILIGILGFSLTSRTDVETTILRTSGMLFQRVDSTKISNLYNLQIVNKTIKEIPIELRLIEPEGEIEMVGKKIIVEKQGIYKGVFFVKIPTIKLDNRKTKIKLEIVSNGEVIDTRFTNFLGPIK